MTRPPRSRGRHAAALTLLALPGLALSGCGPNDQDLAAAIAGTATHRDGGVLVAPDEVTAGQPVDVSIAGSKIGDDPQACPVAAFVFRDGGAVEQTVGGLETLASGSACSVVKGEFRTTFAAAEPGVREAVLQVRIEADAPEGQLPVYTIASKTIRVVTPGTGGPPPTGPGTPPAPVRCGTTPSVPDGFSWGFRVNPLKPIAGQPLGVDPGGTTSARPVVRYALDLDNDGTPEATSTGGQLLTTAPGAAGPLGACLSAVDDQGRVATHPIATTVEASGLGAKDYAVPASVPVGAPVTLSITPPPPAGATDGCVWFYESLADADASNPIYPTCDSSRTHAFASPGVKFTEISFFDGVGHNSWGRFVRVTAPTRSATHAARKPRTVKVATTVSGAPKLVTVGRTAYAAGRLSTKGAVLRGRMAAKLTSRQRKQAPALGVLRNADYAIRMDGERVLLSPTAFGLKGTGRLLARSRSDRRTLVCLAVSSDGTTKPSGTTWRILGATGKARGWTGSGTAFPLVVGLPAKRSVSLTAKRGRARSTAGCKGLAQHLPKKGKK